MNGRLDRWTGGMPYPRDTRLDESSPDEPYEAGGLPPLLEDGDLDDPMAYFGDGLAEDFLDEMFEGCPD